MDIEAFEQLVSQWLDQRDDDELRARVAAASRDPALARIRDDWLRLDVALRNANPGLGERVIWNRLHERITEQVVLADSSRSGFQTLRDATSVGDRVDWDTLRGRIMQATTAGDRAARLGAARRRRTIALTFLSAAAAFLLIAFFYPSGPTQSPLGVAQVRVNVSDFDAADDSDDSAFSSVRISAPPDFEDSESVQVAVEQPRVVEVFLMVEPPRASNRAAMLGSPFGFN